MSNTKDTDKYSYFKFIPGQMIFGGALCIAVWIGRSTHYESFWCFLIPLIYLIYTGNRIIMLYTGNRIIMLLSLAGVIAFSINFFANLNLEQTSYTVQVPFYLINMTFYLRDMYFIWKYRLNAFTYSAKTEKSRKKRLFYAKLGFILVFSLCLLFYLLNLLYYSRS